VFATLRNWRRQRVLRNAEIPEALWREALELLPFLAICTDEEFLRLRAKAVLFLYSKSIVGARGTAKSSRNSGAIIPCILVKTSKSLSIASGSSTGSASGLCPPTRCGGCCRKPESLGSQRSVGRQTSCGSMY
jgi:hypothetical protein